MALYFYLRSFVRLTLSSLVRILAMVCSGPTIQPIHGNASWTGQRVEDKRAVFHNLATTFYIRS